ncbi:MAG: tRNA (adenosine(37)-N6)-threonylcarbamoyltransferase complex transferase subunit TsaD, partial [bacterium]
GLYKTKKIREKMSADISEKILTSLNMESEMANDVIELFETTEKPQLDVIAVTQGPGLEPALWVGINFAKTLGTVWSIPVVPTNHMEGHILSVLVDSEKENKTISFPALALLISGGHTELVLIHDWHDYSVIGRTRDDAVGEAFDKVARILGLPYPGGPKISDLADLARERHTHGEEKNPLIMLPRPMLHSKDYDFSFSGLKTAVLYLVKKISTLSEHDKQNIALEFEESATEVLIKKTREAMIDKNIRTLIIGGGVIANKNIRLAFQKMTELEFVDLNLLIPNIEHSTDNAIMIAVAGYMRFTNTSKVKDPGQTSFRASGNLSL